MIHWARGSLETESPNFIDININMTYPTEIYKQIIDHDSIEQIRQAINEHLLNPEKKVEFDYGTYYSVGEEAHSLVNQLLPKFPNEELSIFLLESTYPPHAHRDRHFLDGRTYIVPIEECDPDSISTIVFNETQTLTETNDEFFKNAPITNNPVTAEFYHSHLRHIPENYIDKLSVETVFPYVLGDIMVFDSAKVHCSNYYRTYDVVKKRGLVIWSNILEEGKDRPNLYNDETKSSVMPPKE